VAVASQSADFADRVSVVVLPTERASSGHEAHGSTNMQNPVPRWAKYHGRMSGQFPSRFRARERPLGHQMEKFIERLDNLRPEKGAPAYLGKSGALAYKYPADGAPVSP
jgi:hypothetical protein